PSSANTFETSFQPDPSLEPQTPQITSLRLDFSQTTPLLDISGQALLGANGTDPEVWLQPPGDGDPIPAQIAGPATDTLIQVAVPQAFAMGTLGVSVTKLDPNTGDYLESNEETLQATGGSLFVAMSGTGQVAVIDARPNSPTFNQLT